MDLNWEEEDSNLQNIYLKIKMGFNVLFQDKESHNIGLYLFVNNWNISVGLVVDIGFNEIENRFIFCIR
jgi:hypothetical protein